MSLEDLRSERIQKLGELRKRGREPYPASVRRMHLISDILRKFVALSRQKKKVSVAGRVVAKREHGGSTFIDLKDEEGKLQAYFKKDLLGSSYDDFVDTADMGDFIIVEGTLFKTKKGEETLEVRNWRMLAKSLLPLPEKWHGLQDVEERFRKRHLDLLVNQEVKDRFEVRTKLISYLRSLLEKQGFLEVETPMLQHIPGGALARPFKTHHNALGIDLYLRIAPELYLKRLLVGGLEKVFELGKSFRNEGIDASHNPEFTMLECYVAYWDEENMMDFVEKTFLSLAKTFGKKQPPLASLASGGKIEFQEKKIVFKKKFSRVTFQDLLKRYAQVVDYDNESRESLATRAKQLGVEVSPHENKGKIADEIYKKICRPYLVQPTFVVNHPLEISPLAKKSEKEGDVRRFQLIVGGMELANGFAELNDPLEQRERFTAQEKERLGGEEEAHRVDEDYLEALEYGMPPAAGLGIGVDRVVMLFTDTKNVREVLLFPTMRPK